MKVTHIIIGLNVGGAELMLKRLIESHQGNPNYRHSVISLTFVGKAGEQLREMGVEVRAFGMRSALDIPRVLWQMVLMFRATRPDIVQTWMYHADLLGGIAAHLAGVRNVIWGIRTTELSDGSRFTSVIRRLCAWLSSWLPKAIVCAADASRKLHEALGYNSARMVVVPNGFDLPDRVVVEGKQDVLRAECGVTAATLIVGTLGRFVEEKDHQNFVAAAGLIAGRMPHVLFLIVGRGLDANNPQLMKWIEDTGYPNQFKLLGERTDAPVCLAAMDVLCMHSRTEGFPNVVGEAMAMGVPCVVTDVGDAALLIADTGVVVPKQDSEALARGLVQLLAMPADARHALGQKARARIEAEFTMDRCRERFEAVYQRLMVEGAR